MRKPLLICIGSLVALATLYWVLAYRDDLNLAKAQQAEATAVAALAEKVKVEEAARLEREAHAEERKQWAERQAELMRSVVARNTATERRIAEVLAPKPIEHVVREVREAFGKEPTQTAQGGFSVTIQEMQEFIALKLDRDRLAENLKETDKQLDLERQATATLRADLDRALKGLEQANGVIKDYQTAMEAYRKAATKTRMRKVLEFGGRAGLTIGLAYLGAKAGSR
jgi:tetratricopeptide (TPR) repeat protein